MQGDPDEEGTADIAQVSAYDELKLRIEPAPGGGHRVLASTPTGEATGSFTLPFSDVEIENFVLRVGRPRSTRRGDTSSYGAAEVFGGKLFESLFSGPVRDLYRTSLARSRAQDHGLRVTLQLSGAPELMDVPWEYLYDDPSFLAVSRFTPVVRYLDLPRGYRPLELAPPMRILAMVSSPNDHAPLDAEKERANLEGALGGLVAAGAVEIEWLERPTLLSLLRRLQEKTFHALHYVGHGSYDEASGTGRLIFQDEGGWGKPVTGEHLGTVLQDFTSLRLAVLNACEGARTSRTDPFAGVAASLVQRDIPAVIAMQFEITDAAAVTFAEGFYRGLAAGAPVDAALAAARLGIFAERSDDIEFGTPVLFMRVGDGQVFDIPSPVVTAPEAGPPAARPAVAPPPVVTGHPPPPAEVPPAPQTQAPADVVRGQPAGPRPLAAPAGAGAEAAPDDGRGRARFPTTVVAVSAAVVATLGFAFAVQSGGDDEPAQQSAAPAASTPAAGTGTGTGTGGDDASVDSGLQTRTTATTTGAYERPTLNTQPRPAASTLPRPRPNIVRLPVATAGPLTVQVTEARNTQTGVRVSFKAKSTVGATLYASRVQAVNERSDSYTPDPFGQVSVPGTGDYVKGTVELQGPNDAKSLLFGWSVIFFSSPQEETSVSVKNVPVRAR